MRKVFFLLIAMLSVTVLNSLVIYSFQPHIVLPTYDNQKEDDPSKVTKKVNKPVSRPTDWLAKTLQYTLDDSVLNKLSAAGAPNLQAVFTSKATSGGFLGIGQSVDGYVDMASPDSDLILTIDSYNMPALMYHETGHVIQKRLVASTVGGYPDPLNVALSAAYYAQLTQLNNDLAGLVPTTEHQETGEGEDTMFPNIEASADCIAQMLGWRSTPVYVVSGQYIDKECNMDQLNVANTIIEGKWPTQANLDATYPKTKATLEGAFSWEGWNPERLGYGDAFTNVGEDEPRTTTVENKNGGHGGNIPY